MTALLHKLDFAGDGHSFTGLRLRGRVRVLPQISRYAVVSVLALTVDFSIYLLLATGGMAAAIAGMIGYAAGLAVHYVLSVGMVFDTRAVNKAQPRLIAEFVLSGLVGLALTAGVIALATTVFGLPILSAKIAATAASFLVVYLLRRCMVFAARA